MVTLLRDHVPEWRLAHYRNMVTQQRDHATRRVQRFGGSYFAAGLPAGHPSARQVTRSPSLGIRVRTRGNLTAM